MLEVYSRNVKEGVVGYWVLFWVGRGLYVGLNLSTHIKKE